MGSVAIYTSSPVAPYLQRVDIFSLLLWSDWELPEDGLCISSTRLQSSPKAKAIPGDQGLYPLFDWELSWDELSLPHQKGLFLG